MLPRMLVLVALATAVLAPSASARTHWLCRPDNASDPCHESITATVLKADGTLGALQRTPAASRAPIDCFYVYPTVSEEPKPQADFKVTPSLRAAARAQASRFRQVCRLWAPIYRQVTLQGLLDPGTVTPAMQSQGSADLLAAWRDYLAHDNHGRGVVLLGDSQGSFELIRILAREIEPRASERRRLVSAVLLGGNVTVAKGKDVGGSFKRVRACRRAAQAGCVIAYSTFNQTPPPNALFGRANEAGREVLCTNPAALGGGAGRLDGYAPAFAFPGLLGQLAKLEVGPLPKATTPWLHVPNAAIARCSKAGGADVLRVTTPGRTLTPEPDPSWGLHISDENLALGTLVGVVRRQAAAYAR